VATTEEKGRENGTVATGPEELLDLRRRLLYHQAMGITAYPLTEELQRFLKTKPAAVEDVRPGRDQSRKSRPPGIVEPVETPIPDEPSRQAALDALPAEIERCTLCSLAAGRSGNVAGTGSVGADLMVVGDWSVQEGAFSPEILFGPGEDEMLWKMMAAIDLDPDRVYVTNCIKCCPAPSVTDEIEQHCLSYLVREIGAVRPRLICAMGETAARLLLGTTVPLVRLRGRFGVYRYQGADTVPVMPTFHPRFLLQHEEMKRATWNDLQLIRHRLQAPGA